MEIAKLYILLPPDRFGESQECVLCAKPRECAETFLAQAEARGELPLIAGADSDIACEECGR